MSLPQPQGVTTAGRRRCGRGGRGGPPQRRRGGGSLGWLVCHRRSGLESLGISLEAVRAQVEEIIGQGQRAPSGHIPFTPRAMKVLELSLRESKQLGHNYVGTEHILLGLIREGEGAAAQVLIRLGADLSRARGQVIGLLTGETGGSEAGARTRLVRMTMPGDLLEAQEQFAQVRQQKERAIDAEDFDRAAALRDQEQQLLGRLVERERAWTAGVDLEAVLQGNQRLHSESSGCGSCFAGMGSSQTAGPRRPPDPTTNPVSGSPGAVAGRRMTSPPVLLAQDVRNSSRCRVIGHAPEDALDPSNITTSRDSWSQNPRPYRMDSDGTSRWRRGVRGSRRSQAMGTTRSVRRSRCGARRLTTSTWAAVSAADQRRGSSRRSRCRPPRLLAARARLPKAWSLAPGWGPHPLVTGPATARCLLSQEKPCPCLAVGQAGQAVGGR
jgi:Clp amino terminal domain, pathogenicity island component/UvrB/uvrC motif